MTNAEHAALVTKLGETGAARCVEILDNYKGANGKKYASDYRAILNWVVERYEEERLKEGVKQTPSQGNASTGDLWAEYARRAYEDAQRDDS